MARITNRLGALVAAGLLAAPLGAHAAIISITPGSDPGGLTVGDTLEFGAVVSLLEPPPGYEWNSFVVDLGISGPDVATITGCENLSSLGADRGLQPNCRAVGLITTPYPFVHWGWVNGETDNTAEGQLFRAMVQFNEPGTYSIFFHFLVASFVDPLGTLPSLQAAWEIDNSNLSITVAPLAEPEPQPAPEPGTLGLLGAGLLGWTLLRRRARATAC